MIRNATESDVGKIYDLIQKTITQIYPTHYPIEAVDFFSNHHSKNNIKQRLLDGVVLVVVSETEIIATGAIVGAEISGVFVDPDFQRDGIGKRLMSELETIAKNNGDNTIELDISLPSKKFYLQLQYEISGFHQIEVRHNETLDYWKATKSIC